MGSTWSWAMSGVLGLGVLGVAFAAGPENPPNSGKFHPALAQRLASAGFGERVKAWVRFQDDKGIGSPAELASKLAELERTYDPHALERRRDRRSRPGLFGVEDLPLSQRRLDAVASAGSEIVVESRWLHAVSVLATAEQLDRIAELPFVVELRPVARVQRPEPITGEVPMDPPGYDGIGPGDYGIATPQNAQLNVIALHQLGYTGAGVRIAVLDTGFWTNHRAFLTRPIDVVAAWDFVDDDGEVEPEAGDDPNQHNHGMMVLGTMAGYWPGQFVGTAYDASYILAKAESLEDDTPAEEDLFVAAVEFAELEGADVLTSSLGQFITYGPEDLDGATALVTQAMNIAVANGVHVFQGAGNEGHDEDPATHHLIVPADTYGISVGAVDGKDEIAFFSSDGPTVDGRLKPELLAWGFGAATTSPSSPMSEFTTVSGTSFATPLLAGAAACLVQAHPDWSPDQMKTHLFLHGDAYLATGAPDPLFVLGFGIPDVLASFEGDCNGNGMDDTIDLAAGTSGDCNGNDILDECDVASGIRPDDPADGLPDDCTSCITGPSCPSEIEDLVLSRQGADVLLSWLPDTHAATYRILRAETAPEVAGSNHGEVSGTQLTFVDAGAAAGTESLLCYLVRAATPGGVVGP